MHLISAFVSCAGQASACVEELTVKEEGLHQCGMISHTAKDYDQAKSASALVVPS